MLIAALHDDPYKMLMVTIFCQFKFVSAKCIQITNTAQRNIQYYIAYIMHGIITWLRCFFPASIDSSPASTDLSPASTDSSLLAFLLLDPPPTIENISSKKKYFLILITSFFISLIWNNTINKYSAMPRMHIFLKNTVNTNPKAKLFRAQFNATGCRLWITACDRSLQNVVNVTQKTLF